MKFSLAEDQRFYFKENEHIEFEGMIPESDFVQLTNKVCTIMKTRQNTGNGDKGAGDGFGLGANVSPDFGADVVGTGAAIGSGAGHIYDLWRESSLLKKVIEGRRFNEIAVQLFEETPIRLGYDLYISNKSKKVSFSEPMNLEEMSAIQGVVGGFLICIEPTTVEESWLPKVAGNVIFVSRFLPLDLNQVDGVYYLVTLASAKSVYTINRNTSHFKAMRKQGYTIGDRLSDELNPVIYR